MTKLTQKNKPYKSQQPMSKITIDLVKLLEQATPQIFGSSGSLLLQQWLSQHIGTTQPVSVDLTTVLVENELGMAAPTPHTLQSRINDVTTFGDNSELHVQVLVPWGSQEDRATTAYYGLLIAISNI